MSRNEEFHLATVPNRALIDMGVHNQNRATSKALSRGAKSHKDSMYHARNAVESGVRQYNVEQDMKKTRAETLRGKNRVQPRISQWELSVN